MRKLKASAAVTKGATSTNPKTPIEAMPDHSQNNAVSNTSNQPPNVPNRTKHEKYGGD